MQPALTSSTINATLTTSPESNECDQPTLVSFSLLEDKEESDEIRICTVKVTGASDNDNNHDIDCFRLHAFDQLKHRVRQLGSEDEGDHPSHIWGDDVKLKLGGWIKWLPQVVSIGSSLFNAALIYYNFYTRPARDSSIPFNLTTLILIYSEFCMQLGIAIACVVSVMLLYCRNVEMRQARTLYRLSRLIDWFSINALTYLPWARPAMFWKVVQQLINSLMKSERVFKAFQAGFCCCNTRSETFRSFYFAIGIPLLAIELFIVTVFYVSLALGSVIIKLSQIAFVGQRSVHDWSGAEWLLLVGLLNNIVSLTNHDRTAQKMIMTAFERPLTWKSTRKDSASLDLLLLELLIEHHGGWRAFLWWRSLVAEETCALLIAAPTVTAAAEPPNEHHSRSHAVVPISGRDHGDAELVESTLSSSGSNSNKSHLLLNE